MAKRWTKQKAQHQQAKRRKRTGGESGGEASAGGAMSGLRRGMQLLIGTGGKRKPETKADKVVNWVLWAAVVVAALVFFRRQCA